MNQNTLLCCYYNYVTTNQQAYKTCWRNFASLPCHIVFKRLVKTSNSLLDLSKASQSVLITSQSVITTTLLRYDVIDKNSCQCSTS